MSEQDALSCIPDTLYMFIKVFYDGQEEIDQDIEDVDEHGGSCEDQNAGILHHKCSHLCKTLYIIL